MHIEFEVTAYLTERLLILADCLGADKDLTLEADLHVM
jgi:hypothetical protein